MAESWNDLSNILLDAGAKLAVSILCGFILGYERERKNKPAGLRTILLITVGSALYMIVGMLLPHVGLWPGDLTDIDPSRIASQVVSGVGFLGAGSIIRARGDIQGLTTAAVIWVAAAIGLAAGIGQPWLALGLTAAVFGLLLILDPLGTWISRQGERRTIDLLLPNDALAIARLEELFVRHNVPRGEIKVEPHTEDQVRMTVTYPISSAESSYILLDALSQFKDVRGLRRFE